MIGPLADASALNQVAARLSLRPPQRAALAKLAEIAGQIELSKTTDLGAALTVVRELADEFEDFERVFPSLCFALATGVGKTRLMGAFIVWLYLTGRSVNFFVLAPNTTIYEKLIADFTPGTPKYVFRGVAEFAQSPPKIVTGDNYAGGAGLRREGEMFDSEVIINVFNVDKINSEKGRIRRLQEYIGESYFDYLSNLPDLVLLMDEAHRYRANAGMTAIAELKPVLGLELTATPKAVGAGGKPFKNVVYRYGLGDAMADGFVKEPAVATRTDFRPADYEEAGLEGVKLDDAVTYHDYVTVELLKYAFDAGVPVVHPFILVVASDTTHASALKARIESDAFHEGRFKGRVIEVHSGTGGVEKDDAATRLLRLEHEATTDIVIHVNKLKEGWDVTNLYTIVPLRASASDILTEQTLGRGLRLPYGRRTGVKAVDTLTVIAHDRFDAIITAAREPGSLVMREITIGVGGDIPLAKPVLYPVPSRAETELTGGVPAIPGFAEPAAPIYTTEPAKAVVRTTIAVVEAQAQRYSTAELATPAVQAKIAAEVDVRIAASTPQVGLAFTEVPKTADIVAKTIAAMTASTIEIPEIVVLPTAEKNFGFTAFNLTGLDAINVRPVSQELLIQEIRTEERLKLRRGQGGVREDVQTNYIVRHLIGEYDEIDYDTNAELLHKLAGQVVARMASYIPDAGRLDDALLVHGRQLASFIHTQLMQHMWTTPTGYRVSASGKCRLLRPLQLTATAPARSFRTPVTPRGDTRRHVFQGFAKCCATLQKFDSDDERELACLLEREDSVERWVKPASGQFQIEFNTSQAYEPDFVVETAGEKLIIEVKARNEMTDPVVLAKAAAARVWCAHATDYRGTGKPWRYLLIPDDMITESATLNGLAASG